MATLLVKEMDDGLYQALRKRAGRDRRSVSQEVISIIEASLAHGPVPPRKAAEAFLELAGTWADKKKAIALATTLRASRRSRDRLKRSPNDLA